MMGKAPVKAILVVVILVLVGILGVLGLNTAKNYLSGAAAGDEPKSVLATPGSDGRSATITWSTDKPVVGVVEYGTTPASLLLRAPEADQTTSHRVEVSPLKPGVNYYFRIRVGEGIFDNNGIPYSFKTKTAVAEVVPTVAPMVTLAPTGGSGCVSGVDYNGDGVMNTLDLINCLKKKPTGKCETPTDINGDGVINSLDRIKCLQSLK